MVSTNFRIHLFLIFFEKKFGTLKKSCNFAVELNYTALLRYPQEQAFLYIINEKLRNVTKSRNFF